MKILFDLRTQPDSLSINDARSATGVTEIPDVGKRRSQAYLAYFKKLDAHVLTSTHGWTEAMEKIQQELGTADLVSLPIGLVGKCYLGHPYEVHILDLSGTAIIKHYKLSEPMPQDFEKARAIAKNPFYDLIEVYSDKVLALRPDGAVIKL